MEKEEGFNRLSCDKIRILFLNSNHIEFNLPRTSFAVP